VHSPIVKDIGLIEQIAEFVVPVEENSVAGLICF
jgi:hypothetical protein